MGQTEADPNLGRTLCGQYRLEALIGQGGMGRVYRGMQLSVKRAVAIKLITGSAPHQPEWAQRFRREAEATARLSHPNSVRLFDFGVTEAQELYMIMELLDGCDLARQLSDKGPLSLEASLQIARQVLHALSEAHALGIVHRDLKPDNVFLAKVRGADTVAKVMDFGIAGIEHARSTKLTVTGAVIGTPAYMSPEQAQGHPVDARSDLYSLGVMLFEMLTGQPPFDAETVVSLLLAHVTQPPPRLCDMGVQLRRQDAVQALLDQLLAKAPEDRPASAQETLACIDAIASGRSTRAARTAHTARTKPRSISVRASSPRHSGHRHTTAMAPPAEVSESITTLDEGRGRASRRLLLASGFVLVIVGALALQRMAAGDSALRAHPAAEVVHNVTIASLPSGARVLLDGAELGKTPYKFRFKRATVLRVTREGYRPETIHLTADSEPSLAIDLMRDRTSAAEASQLSAELTPPDPPLLAANDAPAKLPLATTETSRSAVSDGLIPSSAKFDPARSGAVDDSPLPQSGSLRRAVGHFFSRLLGRGGARDQRADDQASVVPPAASTQPAPVIGDDNPRPKHRRLLGRLVDRLLGREQQRARREVLLDEPLAYPNFPAAQRAYDQLAISLERYEDVIWVLKERRRQRVDAEKDRLARGVITRTEYEARLDRISDEFRGQ